jgi:hypothetical protein
VASRWIAETHTTPTLPELWQRLLDERVLRGGSTQWAGFRHQVREAQRRGEFPILPRAKTGPDKGTPWSEDRRLWEEEQARMLGEPGRRRADAVQELGPTLRDDGRVRLTPEDFAQLAHRRGWGRAVVLDALTMAAGERVTFLRDGMAMLVAVPPVDSTRPVITDEQVAACARWITACLATAPGPLPLGRSMLTYMDDERGWSRNVVGRAVIRLHREGAVAGDLRHGVLRLHSAVDEAERAA